MPVPGIEAYRHTLDLPTSTQGVFEALTDPKQIVQWFSEHAEVEPRSDGIYRFWGKYTPWVATRDYADQLIVEFKPDRLLEYSWTWRGRSTRVRFMLTSLGSAAALTVSHSFDRTFEERCIVADFWTIMLGNLRAYLKTGTPALRPDFSSRRKPTEFSIVIDAPPDRVFDALTNPSIMKLWIASDPRVEPTVGGEYSFGWSAEGKTGKVTCGPTRIVELEANRRLVSNWTFPDDPESLVYWDLEEVANGTRVTLRHDITEEEMLVMGWTGLLLQLQAVLEDAANIYLPQDDVLGHGCM